MSKRSVKLANRWCIVVADDNDLGSVPTQGTGLRGPSPIQYCTLDASRTLFEKALRRAGEIAPSTRIIVTAVEAHRPYWEAPIWAIRPEHRVIGDFRMVTPLTTAAAMLLVAAKCPTDIVILMPAKCYVTHEDALVRGMGAALGSLPSTPEGVVTLGMIDIADGVDEDYVVPARGGTAILPVAQGMARRPVPWVARHLRENGAMAASGILVGFAGVFAEHVRKHWPRLSMMLTHQNKEAQAGGTECRIPLALRNEVTGAALRSIGWCPPAFPQRIVRVEHTGWSGLRSARAVIRACALSEWRNIPGADAHRRLEAPLRAPEARSR